jgi:prevent-host-death family protein
MNTYTIYEAKTNFSQLVKRAIAGERIYIGSHGNPTVELVAASQAVKPKTLRGIWEGKFVLPPDWDEMDQQIADSMLTSDLGID